MNSIYKKPVLNFKSAPTSVKDILKIFLDSKSNLYSFDNQDELIEDIKSFCNNNKRSIPDSLTQSNISRALQEVMRLSFLKSGETYVLLREKGRRAKGSVKKYHFAKMNAALFPFFKISEFFLQNSVFVMSANTLVFDIAEDKHAFFLDVFNENFSEETLWGYTSMGSKLVLMFNTGTSSQEAKFNLFKRFFEIKKEHDNSIHGKIKKN